MTVLQTPAKVIIEPRRAAAKPHRSAVHHPSRSAFRTQSRYRSRRPEPTPVTVGPTGQGAQVALSTSYWRSSLGDRALTTELVVDVLAAALARAARLLTAWGLWRSLLHRSRLKGHALSVVLVGPPAEVRHVLRLVERKACAAYKVVGVVLDGAVAPGDATQDWGEVDPALCYVGIEEVDAAVRDLGADAVVVVGPLWSGHQYIRDLGWERTT